MYTIYLLYPWLIKLQIRQIVIFHFHTLFALEFAVEACNITIYCKYKNIMKI